MLEITDEERRRSVALLLKDALTLTPVAEIEEATMIQSYLAGLSRLVDKTPITHEEEVEIFKGLLNAGWTTTASFDPEKWKDFLPS
jgi:hypothetical protein